MAYRPANPEKSRRVVPLDYPIVGDDGKVISEVVLTRLTARQVQDFVDAVMAGETRMPPISDIPDEAFDALDDDDRVKVEEAAADFMPARLRAAQQAGFEQMRRSASSKVDGGASSAS